MDKIIVFTANIGGYDKIKTPTVIDSRARYILFTDDFNFKHPFWEVRYIKTEQPSVYLARFIKIKCHELLPPHIWSVWFDSCFEIRVPSFNKMITDNFLGGEVMCYKHPLRDCAYLEASICHKSKLDKEEVLKKQVTRYKKQGFPKNCGLFASGVIIRKNTIKVKRFNDLWWAEVSRGSSRDQVSQVYASWKTKVKISKILVGASVYSNPYSKKKRHIKKRVLV